MKSVEFTNGVAFLADSADLPAILSTFPPIVLTLTDPPYGNILKTTWDRIKSKQLVYKLVSFMSTLAPLSIPGAAAYIFGGIGTPNNRPFFNFILRTESETPWQLSNFITWKKSRAYGVQHNYLFCREELAFFINGDIKRPAIFNIPLLNDLRGYPGYNKKYPAKSPYLRRSNVWTDPIEAPQDCLPIPTVWENITELLSGKIHPAQKPVDLLKIPILTHTNPGDHVLDPFAGSGSTAIAAAQLNRKFILIEKDPVIFDSLVANLNKSLYIQPLT